MTETLTIEGDVPASGEAAAEQVVTLARPLLGFPGSRRFAIRGLGERYAPFLALASLDEPGLDFIAVAPGAVFSDYVVEIEEADTALLGIESSEEVAVLVLVSRHPGATPTVNLMGPLVVNTRTAVATQVVLQDGRYGAAVPVDAGSATAGAPGARAGLTG